MIFVTGATGFLGSHLLYKLVKVNKNVKALIRKGSNKSNVEKTFALYSANYRSLLNKIQWVEGALEDIYSLTEAMQGCEYIYHCAAYVSFDKKDNVKMHSINIEGTKNMVNAALELQGLKKFCHVSSIASLGSAKEGKQYIDESCEWEPKKNLSFYSKTKYESELEVFRGINEGLNAVIVLPSVILGAGDWNTGSPQLLSKGFSGQSFYTTGINGFVDVKDVVNIMIKLTENFPDICDRYIINSENLSYKELFTLCAHAIGKQAPKIKASPFMAYSAYLLENLFSKLRGKKPALTKQAIRIAFGESFYSNQKITELLDYRFVSIKDCINQTAESFLKEKNN